MSKVLFFGELSPNIIHGISLANRLNTDLLSDSFDVNFVEEKSDFKEYGKKNSSKIKKIFSYTKEVFSLNKKKKYNYFYTVFSLSTFGSLKTLFTILAYVISGSGQVVLHIHRGDFEVFYSKFFFNKFISKIVFKMTDKLIVLSENQKKEFSKYFHKEKIYIVENSLNEEYTFDKNLINRNNFLFISNYIKEKGIFGLLKVFTKYDDKYLECFGNFVNNEDEIKSYESETIKINSFINGKEKYQKINESDALILPSWNEGQPTIILEAMMMGTIVLTTKVGLISELLGDEYPFYFMPNDENSLRKCIARFEVFENKNDFSKKLKNMYFDKYSKNVHAKKILKAFEQ